MSMVAIQAGVTQVVGIQGVEMAAIRPNLCRIRMVLARTDPMVEDSSKLK